MMHTVVCRLVAAGALAGAAFAARADEPRALSKPFLECAALHARYLSFVKESSDYEKADQAQELEKYVQFYLQIAESLSERRLRQEFLESCESEEQKAKKTIATQGRDAYVAYYVERRKECTNLLKKHQKEIMDAADRLYDGQGKR
jgi:hypothetical protein